MMRGRTSTVYMVYHTIVLWYWLVCGYVVGSCGCVLWLISTLLYPLLYSFCIWLVYGLGIFCFYKKECFCDISLYLLLYRKYKRSYYLGI